MHHLPGCCKSFYNKLHKALWCPNIYGCMSFPWGLFSVKVATALSRAEWLQTSYLSQGKGSGGLHQKRTTQRKRPLISASSCIYSPHPRRLLADSIDLTNKNTAAWPLLTRQTNKLLRVETTKPVSVEDHEAVDAGQTRLKYQWTEDNNGRDRLEPDLPEWLMDHGG